MRKITSKECAESVQAFHELNKKKVFFAIPNMGKIDAEFLQLIFASMGEAGFESAWWAPRGNMHHDWARNVCVKQFLESKMEYLAFMDSDTPAPQAFLELVKYRVPIISGAVFCLLRNHKGQDMLLPSIWMRANCEECFCLKKWLETGEINDPRSYRINPIRPGILQRWNPFRQIYCNMADENGWLKGVQCRCGGTGRDPWVYNFDPKAAVDSPYECDSAGTAALVIHRSVFDKLKWPYFQFLYRESREIMLTEDHFFCWQAKEAGFKILAHTGVVSPHLKEVDLSIVFNLLNRHVERAVRKTRDIVVKEMEKQQAEPLITAPSMEAIRAVSR